MNALHLTKKVTLSSSEINPIFGKVFYQSVDADVKVTFTLLMPRISEGWKTGVALDASQSMKPVYGKLSKPTENLVEIEARKFLYYLADHLDAEGQTTTIYWACSGGRELEVIGDIQASECSTLKIDGPVEADFGSMTNLLPALRYFVEGFPNARNGIYLFVTDGRINDFLEVKEYCINLANQIISGKRNPIKCVLIGVGEKVDTRQLQYLDNLDVVTGFDLWDYHVAKDMRETTDIFAELVDESVIVATTATIYDDQNTVIKQFTDGLPGRVTFLMRDSSSFFELEVAGQRIRQSLLISKAV